MIHRPVLLNEVIEVLAPKAGEFFIDGTIDGGGHALAILEKLGPTGKLLGLDWDEKLILEAKKRLPKKGVKLINDNFKNLAEILKKNHLPKADGLLLDLGFSLWHLEKSQRGFSFQIKEKDEPLIMTYSLSQKPLWQWLKELKINQLAEIIKKFGQERYAFRLAKMIKKNPPKTTSALVKIIKTALPKNWKHQRLHPATKTFLALRIFVNQELENLEIVLSKLEDIVKSGGRVAIISFNSLEDRLVKNAFKKLVKNQKGLLINKKPILPTLQEIKANPSCRSARLRAIKIL